ncbi:hypothetical protein H6G96_03765 [Nostoc sp. FACHB-892]|uniref:hypothetical protein n=1 Tax=Nostoc sp. FACHB-892 TaxID=2692843 RepID=UPI001685EDDA|nr:hypothetical protein [Nostoc sp. FACHB-892]MBD2725459.1 hypothetical protein [Nostoc sp. FACHB-892]
MKANLRITKFIIFCIGAYILIPKIATSTGMFTIARADTFGATSSNSLIAPKVNDKDKYVPPNYGGPDSQQGSGTR